MCIKNKKYGYVLPYCIINGQIYALVGKKKCFIPKGYICRNPGQIVIVGGFHNNLSKNYQILDKFYYETGQALKTQQISHIICSDNFVMLFCRITANEEIKKLCVNANFPNATIQSLHWFNLKELQSIFCENTKYNEICDGNTEKAASLYLKLLQKLQKIPFEFRNFSHYLVDTTLPYTPEHILCSSIIYRQFRFKLLVENHIREHFFFKSKTRDFVWFYEGVSLFIENSSKIF